MSDNFDDMSAAVEPLVEPPSSWATLRATWQEVDVPEGYRAEISEGAIRMNPPPGGKHTFTASKVHRLLLPHTPPGIEVFQSAAVEMPDIEKLYLPDLVVAAEASLRDDGTVAPEDVLVAVEITSPGNANTDRQEKLVGYGRGGVPAYLLIDRVRSTGPVVSLYTELSGGEYTRVVQVPFGETIALPKPFDVDLDTAMFPTDSA